MQVEFRECNFFNLWLWLEFETTPSLMERQYIEEIFDSWFFLGKLGGFNAENLQVQETGLEISYMDYDNTLAGDSLLSLMHNIGDVEYEGTWARCWVDMGTSDAIAVDVLINAFTQFNRDFFALKRLVIGGENSDWPVPNSGRPEFESEDS
ncbi:DUF3531 family protein [Pseudanabaena sp. FACHB-2040]|uniref:DUF3531 family protein n=1 Tax=Pseudanabaena sp. FACHB-2040 TaxID=2692859 RepID=UPI001686906A|nr:DUF3531 family protein [Pseudanabaena sp. FACHB-2040]MBD2259681.1 DUF3531 family protein [Pseudanabaena sp. FACHB-2040]